MIDGTFEVGIAIICLIAGLTLWTWRRPVGQGNDFFLLTHVGLMTWLGLSILQVASPTASCKVFWYTLTLPALTFSTMSWSLFLIEFGPLQLRGVRRWGYPALAVSTLALALLAATNGWHESLVTSATQLTFLDERPSITPQWGRAFYGMLAYNYGWVTFAAIVSLRGLQQAGPSFRLLFGNLLIMTLVPVVTNTAYLLFGFTIAGVDPTPYGFVISLVAYGWILVNSRLLSVEVVGERYLYQYADHPKVIVERAGKLVSMNPFAKALIDGPGGEQMRETVDRMVATLIAGEKIDPHHHDVIDGRAYRPSVLFVENPVHPDRPFLGWTINMVDVTEEEETAQRLMAANERAEEIVRLQSELVSVISHELRTPLTSIRGTLDLLEVGKFGELPIPAQRGIGIARRNSRRLGRLIDDLLNLHKLEAGQFEFHLDDLEVTHILEAAIEDLESYALQRNVRLVFNKGSQAWIRADFTRLQQVISNVVSNAVKFSADGGVVRIEAVKADDFVEVLITDTGVGIAEGSEENVFGRFAQIDSSSTRAQEGTGLGMTIAKLMIEEMGGQIYYRSKLGVGTTFHLLVPLAKVEKLEAVA
ncbi:hypothetical protein I8N54_09140 [Pelagovum pacificum]|nr:hypothetical protein I8N54_09140 [Pelagovum pacificum]